MSVFKSFETGKGWLRNASRQFFGSPEPKPEPVDRETTISFPTGTGRKPLDVKCSLFKLPEVWGDDAWRIIVNVSGARHPYDPKCEHGYFGEEIMNPALVPATNLIAENLEAAAEQSLNKPALRKSMCDYEGSESGRPVAKRSMHGRELWVTFNGSRLSARSHVDYADIASIYDALEKSIRNAAPSIQKKIDQHALFQPPLNPEPSDRLLFDAYIHEVMCRALGEATGYRADTKFVGRDGRVRNLMKGIDP